MVIRDSRIKNKQGISETNQIIFGKILLEIKLEGLQFVKCRLQFNDAAPQRLPWQADIRHAVRRIFTTSIACQHPHDNFHWTELS